MANCDMCGIDSNIFIAEVEGTRMNVCKDCSKFGKIIKTIRPEVEKKIELHERRLKRLKEKTEPEIITVIVEDYPQIIRGKREEIGMRQKEFARFIAEKESLLHNLETGKQGPSLDLARKLERLLKIKLIESIEDDYRQITVEKSTGKVGGESGFTLGDFIKKKE